MTAKLYSHPGRQRVTPKHIAEVNRRLSQPKRTETEEAMRPVVIVCLLIALAAVIASWWRS